MHDPPLLVIIPFAILMFLVVGFLYLGGLVLILLSSWVPVKSRMRWVAFSVSPYAVLVLVLLFIKGLVTLPPHVDGDIGDPFALFGLMLIVGAIGTHWLCFSSFRAAFPRPSKEPGAQRVDA